MGNTTKRSKGAAKELGGKAERKLGRVLGSRRMAARGSARELEGKAEKESAKARERVKGAIEETTGRLRRKANR
jgi:uncharacterized protein YjbJ (UPF0337 family)